LALRLYLKYGRREAINRVVAAECEDAGRFFVDADQELPAFREFQSGIKTHRHIMSAIARDRMKNWEAIADNCQQGRLELGLAFDSEGRTSWIANAHRDDGNRFDGTPE
jgi:hypothetical protein